MNTMIFKADIAIHKQKILFLNFSVIMDEHEDEECKKRDNEQEEIEEKEMKECPLK